MLELEQKLKLMDLEPGEPCPACSRQVEFEHLEGCFIAEHLDLLTSPDTD